MRYRVDYYLRSTTKADADTVSSRVEQDLNGRTDYQRHHGPAVYLDADSHLLWVASGGGWVTTEAGAREVQGAVQSRMDSGPVASRIVAGSVVELHPCRNEDTAGCDPTTIERVVK